MVLLFTVNSWEYMQVAKMFLSETSYPLYMGFIGILLAVVSQLHHHSDVNTQGTLIGIRIAVLLFVTNFIALALQETMHGTSKVSLASGIHIVFYITMILGPGVLLYLLVLQPLGCYNFIQNKYYSFFHPTTTISPSKEADAETHTHTHTDMDNSFPPTIPLTEIKVINEIETDLILDITTGWHAYLEILF